MSWGYVGAAAVVTVGGMIASNQERKAAEGAANAQKKAAREAGEIRMEELEEQRRQFDLQLNEYRRKQGLLEDQYSQLQTMLAPYQQGGQGAFYEMLALSGIAAPEGAKVTVPEATFRQQYESALPGPPRAADEQGRMGILGGATDRIQGLRGTLAPFPTERDISDVSASREMINLPANVDPMEVAAELQKGGLSLSSSRWDTVKEETAAAGQAPARYYAAKISQRLKELHPDWTTQDIHNAIASSAEGEATQRFRQAESGPRYEAAIAPAESPYAGMTGTEAQELAISRIAESPLLQELTRQGEQAILQQASATGGLRGGNVQGMLAQYRPAMLKQAIEEQFGRLAQISGAGLGATTTAPYMPQASGYPGVLPADTYMAELAARRGDTEAARMLSEGQYQSGMIGDISELVGFGAGRYINRPQSTARPGASGGLQAVSMGDEINYY